LKRYNMIGQIREALHFMYAGKTTTAIEILESTLKIDKEAMHTPEQIVQAVTRVTGVQYWEMQASTRKAQVSKARQYAMYAITQYTRLPLKAIGGMFGNRDHSTVIHARDTMKDTISVCKHTRSEWARIEEILRGGVE